MRANCGQPWLDDGPEGLGVRVPVDIKPDSQGMVRPAPAGQKGKGMSVTPDVPERMRAARRPKALGGESPLPLWSIDEQVLVALLRFRPDPGEEPEHGVIEPAVEMTLTDYRAALQGTQASWHCVMSGADEEAN